MPYAPVNSCIYCGLSDVQLTREHIIPFSLGGTLVLPKASCKAHAAITSFLERDVARIAYGAYRAEAGTPSRRPGELTRLLNRVVEIEGERFDGTKVIFNVPIKDVPPVPVVVRLKEPGIAVGNHFDAEGECQLEMPPTPDPRLQTLRERLGLKSLTGPVSTIPFTNLLRALAKIAHAYATAELGLGGFRPSLLSLILDGPAGAWYYVGEHNPPAMQARSALNLRFTSIGAEKWAVVDISLHFFPRMPMYQVFVGTLPP